ncbi:MAG TPA: aminotransferase class IV [Puia sp.]|nr:aminotransferase class IV [Puia sp.]
MLLNFNGRLRHEEEMLLRADNRGFRYGDGLFETMLVREAGVRLGRYHLERLARGMKLLGLALADPFTLESLGRQIEELRALNGLTWGCRARLTVFREASGLYTVPDSRAAYFLQTSESGGKRVGLGSGVRSSGTGEEDDAAAGLRLGVFPHGRKACDDLASIKSNNYLLSSLAGVYAREHGWDECVLLNSFGRIAETAAANIWWVRDRCCFTPPLSEGCVAGVMRRFLLEALPAAGFCVREERAEPRELADAGEIFISNAIRGVRGVTSFEGRDLSQTVSAAIQREIIQTL